MTPQFEKNNMKYEIKNRLTGEVIFSTEAKSLKEAVEKGIKQRISFSGANFSGAYLADANFSGANFDRANFSGAYLAFADFVDANFSGANFSGANFDRANFSDANFSDANFSFADFDRAYFAGANFDRANFDRANFSDANFSDANFSDANFAFADFSDANFDRANFAGANFADADFANAKNIPAVIEAKDPFEHYVRNKYNYIARAERYRNLYPDVPVVFDLDKKILDSLTKGEGKLNMSDWHTCETTHCRAGWAITLAGETGKELEKKFGPRWAATMIYRASTGRVPNFFAKNEQAMEDIKACAEGTAK